MDATMNGELVWTRVAGKIRMSVVSKGPFSVTRFPEFVQVSNVHVPLSEAEIGQVLYRHPILLSKNNDRWTAGPVFAILAGSGDASFVGARTNFRDIINAGRTALKLIYVLPANEVTDQAWWSGYIRMGYKKWIELPMPRPEAVYNRIPTRMHEGKPDAVRARKILRDQRIPMFNPTYFNKSVIYDALRAANLQHFLPETRGELSRDTLLDMVQHHDAVYLKPAGGSVGHGMIRIERLGGVWDVAVLKNGSCSIYKANTLAELFRVVEQHRVRGRYVLQRAIPLLHWQGRPCDFRVLLQKGDRRWHVVGKGVRVSGPNAITTHVPNGGYIANAETVLAHSFGSRAFAVDDALDSMVLKCADAIDQFFQGELGEMSMDIGIDSNGDLWFFEANSKPMKFDEPEIRSKSLQGILNRLENLRLHRPLQIETS